MAEYTGQVMIPSTEYFELLKLHRAARECYRCQREGCHECREVERQKEAIRALERKDGNCHACVEGNTLAGEEPCKTCLEKTVMLQGRFPDYREEGEDREENDDGGRMQT